MILDAAMFAPYLKKDILPTSASSISKQHRASASNTEPLPGRLHLLVLELLQVGAGAGNVGRSARGLQAGDGQPGQHRHQLRAGLRFRRGRAGHGRLDRTQTRGANQTLTHVFKRKLKYTQVKPTKYNQKKRSNCAEKRSIQYIQYIRHFQAANPHSFIVDLWLSR